MRLHVRLTLGLLVLAALPAVAQEIPCEWADVERIVAVGDVHGDAEQLVACLRASGVIDAQQKWIGGKTHLVQLGDVLDRGPDSKKAMDLLRALEPQAAAAGGRVHALIGNHEAMILSGNDAYLHETEAEAYGGLEAFRKAMAAAGDYGKWIRGHNAVIRINDILFVHGGLSPAFANRSLAEINRAVRETLVTPAAENLVDDPLGPLWFRGLAVEEDPAQLRELLAPVLKKYGAKHVVLGHTTTPTLNLVVKAGGAVILADVGLSKTYRGGPALCLAIEKGKFFAVTPTEKKPLPVE